MLCQTSPQGWSKDRLRVCPNSLPGFSCRELQPGEEKVTRLKEGYNFCRLVLLFENLTIWNSYCLEILLFRNLTIQNLTSQESYYSEIFLLRNLATQKSHYLEISQYRNLTIQKSDYSEI